MLLAELHKYAPVCDETTPKPLLKSPMINQDHIHVDMSLVEECLFLPIGYMYTYAYPKEPQLGFYLPDPTCEHFVNDSRELEKSNFTPAV